MFLMDYVHQQSIGVLMDRVPSHFLARGCGWPSVARPCPAHPNMLVIGETVGAFSDLRVSGACGFAAAL
jgi:hypothetical protein